MNRSPATRRRSLVWVVLAVALVVALLVGSGVFSSKPMTNSQRVQSIASGIKCPSCEDLSVANSNAQTAITVRNAIAAQVAAGRTDQQIDDYLIARYGSSIVLTPPTSGWSLLVWLLPLAAGVVALGGLTVFVVRRRRQGFAGEDESADTVAPADMSAEMLSDRRAFLERSLADATAEHDAGDLSDVDYDALFRRDRSRLEAIESRMVALDEGATAVASTGDAVATANGGPTAGEVPTADAGSVVLTTDADPSVETADADVSTELAEVPGPASGGRVLVGRPRRTRRQRFLMGGAVTALGSAVVLAVVLIAVPRLPGQTETGNVTLNQQQEVAQKLAQAAASEDTGQFGQAAQLYNQILSQDPHQAQATAQLGWLDYQVGSSGKSATLTAEGRKLVESAVQLDPQDFAGHLYLGTILLQQDHDAAGAVAQYQEFLAATNPGPGAAVIKQAAPYIRQAFAQAGVAVPSKVPAA
jgi:cytochrome c-type biogenesis protein CcmH